MMTETISAEAHTVGAKHEVNCYHCNEPCHVNHIKYKGKDFCCAGCQSVYALLEEGGLGSYYEGRKAQAIPEGKYDYLLNDTIVSSLLDFESKSHCTVRIKLPSIHCSSCIYVLENLYRLDKGIFNVAVNFGKREANIHFDPSLTTLFNIALLLDTVGYPPQFDTEKEGEKTKRSTTNSSLSIKIGIAAFSFGNIMLLSFPEYLGFTSVVDTELKSLFVTISALLSLLVVFYSGNGYLIAAWKGLKKGHINIDVPIALGMLILLFRSYYDAITYTGPGYFDSLAGLVFFLLIGRWFQSKTYDNLSFERDYKSYFPLAVIKADTQKAVPIQQLVPGDEIIIRNQEVIPADAMLLDNLALVDYSFVTGESEGVPINKYEPTYAGGRLVGGKARFKVTKKSSHSYLTSLWENQAFKDNEAGTTALVDKVSRYFTPVILAIAFVAFLYWLFIDSVQAWPVFTAVLIVACPCALALSAPFTNGNTIRIFGRNHFYLKNAQCAETIPDTDTIVFDKTGTITNAAGGNIMYHGEPLTKWEQACIKVLCASSTHPKSKQIYASLQAEDTPQMDGFQEYISKGLAACFGDKLFKVGSAKWVGADPIEGGSNKVYVSVGKEIKGYFESVQEYRDGLESVLQELTSQYQLKVLSGDNDSERATLEVLFPTGTEIHFNQTPHNKLEFIKKLQANGHKVMMLGDGLNDAGALKQSNFGIAVTEDTATFSPASDAILEGGQLHRLATLLKYSHRAKRIIFTSFGISILYNIIGLGLAVTGALTPISAAILMPVSSISVVAFTTLSGNWLARRSKL